jgi:hypothetical protein
VPGRREAPPPDYPAWLKPGFLEDWYKRGLVIWDQATQSVERLGAQGALDLLEKLRSTAEWRTEGVPITYRVSRMKGNEEKPRRARKRKRAEEPPAEEKQPEWETVDAERFRLTPDAGGKLMALIQEHEALLREIAQEEEKERERANGELFRLLSEMAHRSEVDHMDCSTRAVPWTRSPHEYKLVCDLPPNRATVYVEGDGLFWQACIEQPDRFKHESLYMLRLEDAITWAEQELKMIEEEAKQAAAQADVAPAPRREVTEVAAELKTKLRRYWIDPCRLEPERITYAVIIELEYAPYDFKTTELSFGKLFYHDKRYLSAERVARELGIDPGHVAGEQYGRIGLYKLTSNVTYFREDVATAQAQQMWDRSQVLAQYKAGKVKWALYGCTELETEFSTWLGGCGAEDRPRLKPTTREEHMLHAAIEETLAYALDVKRFREYRRFPSKGPAAEYFTDDKLLAMLHERRARSPHVPRAAKLESQRWLAKHPQEE